MREANRMTLRFDFSRDEQRKACELIREKSVITGKTYVEIISEAVLKSESEQENLVAEILQGVKALLKDPDFSYIPENTGQTPKTQPEIDIDWSFIGS